MKEEYIDGHKIPQTEKGKRYAYVREDTDVFYNTFNSIEECIEDAHYNWEHRCGCYEDVDENGIDEIYDFKIERPIIKIGTVNSIVDTFSFEIAANNSINEVNFAINHAVEEFDCDIDIHHCNGKLKVTQEEYLSNYRKFIKDNFTIYPNDIITKMFYLRYDLLADKWINIK